MNKLIPRIHKYSTYTFLVVLLSFLSSTGTIPKNEPTADSMITSITVVSDDNYPPFIFRNRKGELEGIIVDEWRLWEKKTGVTVHITAMDWNDALKGMENKKYDVIDTIFKNVKREEIFDFTPPYATIDVPIFFHKDISGISSVDDLSGFIIGAKKGDNIIDVLAQAHITNLKQFDNYEDIIRAAEKNDIKVFSIDYPPALFFLNKYGISQNFKKTEPVYSGRFHRAVLKNNKKMLSLINEGFARITENEHKSIEKKWYGSPVINTATIQHFFIVTGIGIGVIALLFLWVFLLRRTVDSKTRELHDANDKITALFDSVNDAIIVFNQELSINEVNGRFTEMYGYSREEALTFKLGNLRFNKNEYTKEELMGLLSDVKSSGPVTIEMITENKYNTAFPVEIIIHLITTGTTEKYLANIRDITERKRNEEQIKQSLNEKELLLRELYHRTKNNMQVICSLIRLKSTETKNNELKNIFIDMENRIHSMSLVHQKLYSSGDLSNINLNDYIKDLTNLLIISFEQKAGNIAVRLLTTDVYVTIETAIPCGLILNELITNSFKHAFPHEMHGEITITLKKHDDNRIEFSVSDNGIGVTDGSDILIGGKLGMKSIMNIGKQQLDAEIIMSTSNGVTCTILFTDKQYH